MDFPVNQRIPSTRAGEAPLITFEEAQALVTQIDGHCFLLLKRLEDVRIRALAENPARYVQVGGKQKFLSWQAYVCVTEINVLNKVQKILFEKATEKSALCRCIASSAPLLAELADDGAKTDVEFVEAATKLYWKWFRIIRRRDLKPGWGS